MRLCEEVSRTKVPDATRVRPLIPPMLPKMSVSGHSRPSHSAPVPTNDRGRDASYLAPPAQIRTGPIRAYGSHLECMTALRDILVTCRMRSNACDTVTRL